MVWYSDQRVHVLAMLPKFDQRGACSISIPRPGHSDQGEKRIDIFSWMRGAWKTRTSAERFDVLVVFLITA